MEVGHSESGKKLYIRILVQVVFGKSASGRFIKKARRWSHLLHPENSRISRFADSGQRSIDEVADLGQELFAQVHAQQLRIT